MATGTGKFMHCPPGEDLDAALREMIGKPKPTGVDALDEALKAAKAKPTSCILDAAEMLLALGLWPVPLYRAGVMRKGKEKPTNGKEPYGNAWGVEQNTPESLRNLCRNSNVGGVGVALGPGRGPGGAWLIDIEGDGPEADESRLKLFGLFGGEIVQTKGWGSPRGSHLLLIAGAEFLEIMQLAGATEGGGYSAGVFKLAELPGLEFRIGGYHADGTPKQLQSACPPTPGTDGKPREWSECETIAGLPDTAYGFIEALAERRAVQDEVPPAQPSFKIRAPVTGDGKLDNLERAALYSAKLDPSISGQRGHDRAYRAACRVGPGFNLSIDQTIDVLDPWNQTCQPPWSPAELRHKVEDAFRLNTLPLGYMLDAGRANGQATSANGRAASGPTQSNGQAAKLKQAQQPEAIDYSKLTDAEMGVVHLEDVDEENIEWLWEYRLAIGELAIVAGEGGLGKSQLLLSITAAVSTGGEWPDKKGKAPVGRVLILAAEDSPSTTIKPRLMAMGADIANVTIIEAKTTVKRPDGSKDVSFKSLQDLNYWRDVLGRFPDTILIIIDPLPSYLGKGVNDSKNNEIRAILEPFIADVLRPRRICMLTNAHLNKNVGNRNPIHRINGSVAYSNLARNTHFVGRDKDDPTHRIFAQRKCNNAPEGLPAIGFRVEARKVTSKAGVEIETAIPVFDADPLVGVDVDALIAGDGGASKSGVSSDQQVSKVDACARFIVDHLYGIGAGIPVRWGDLLDACGMAGFAGACDPNTGRWSNKAMINRAVDRFNDVDHKPDDLAMYRIGKATDDPNGEGRAKAFYLVELPTPE